MCFIEQRLFEAAAALLPRLMTGQQVPLSADHVRSFDDLSSLGSDPKGPCPVEHLWNTGLSFQTSVLPPLPHGYWGLKSALSGLILDMRAL